MAVIDERLIDCDTDQDVTENFNRIMGLIDELGEKIEELTPSEEETPDEEVEPEE